MASELYRARSALNGSIERLARWDDEIDRLTCLINNNRLHPKYVEDLEAKKREALEARYAEKVRNELYRDRYVKAKTGYAPRDGSKLLLVLPKGVRHE